MSVDITPFQRAGRAVREKRRARHRRPRALTELLLVALRARGTLWRTCPASEKPRWPRRWR
jgi:hypothetical protein